MIRKVEQKDIKECVDVIVKSFMTVADEFGFTIENASLDLIFNEQRKIVEGDQHEV